MRRNPRLFPLVAGMMFGLLVVLGSGAARAQDATPAAGEMMEPEGVTFAPLGFAQGVTLPSAADLIAVRLSIDPGATLPLDPGDPTGGLLVVESGTFTVNVETALSVTRGAAMQQAMATPENGDMSGVMEAVAAGTEVTLGAGDSAYIPGGIAGELRNVGAEPAVGLAFLVGPAGMMSEEGAPATPTP